jgi:hypothetical protein
VAQNLGTGVVVLIPGEVTADTPVVITVQDAIGQTATSSVTVRPAPLFNTLTVVPSRTVCGTNAVCSGDTATATVTVTGIAGAGIPNRQVKFDVVLGAFGIQSGNPAQPLVSSLTVVSDANGTARVVLQSGVNVPTQPAQIRATDLTTGNAVTASFTIVQQTDGAAILSVIPPTATITGTFVNQCSSGFRIDYFIYGGTPPYSVSSTFPTAVGIVNSTVLFSGGAFEAVTNGTCVNPLVFTIVDATGRQTTAQLINAPGTMVIPPPTPPTALKIAPATVAATCAAGQDFVFVVTGGTPNYNAFISPTTGAALVMSAPGDPPNSFRFHVMGTGIFTVGAVDSGSPQQSATATITCT